MEIGKLKENCERQRNFNNFNNLIYLTTSNSQSTYAAAQPSTLLQTFDQVPCNFAPRIMHSNTMSLVPKLVETQEFLLRKRVDICLITETWLNDNISDSIAHIDGHNLHRKYRLYNQTTRWSLYIP